MRPSKFASVARGFSLLEVLLAVVIGAGLFLAVLSFYQQTAETREVVTEQLDAVGSARRVMQHLTTELRAAAHPDTGVRLSGSSQRMTFATTTVPREGRAYGSDLLLVAYSMGSDGLSRSERPVSLGSGGASGGGAVGALGADDDEEDQQASGEPLVLTDQLRFVRFRYWTGQEWSDTWQQSELPAAVQIMLAERSVPEELEPEEYPPDVFRRTVSVGYRVPGGGLDDEADADPLFGGGG